MRFENNEEFQKHLKQQVEENEKYLTPEEKEKKERIRQSNRKSVKKYFGKMDALHLRMPNDVDENGFTLKEKIKLFVQEELGISAQALLFNSVTKAMEDYEAVHGKIDYNELKMQAEEKAELKEAEKTEKYKDRILIEKLTNQIKDKQSEIEKTQSEIEKALKALEQLNKGSEKETEKTKKPKKTNALGL